MASLLRNAEAGNVGSEVSPNGSSGREETSVRMSINIKTSPEKRTRSDFLIKGDVWSGDQLEDYQLDAIHQLREQAYKMWVLNPHFLREQIATTPSDRRSGTKHYWVEVTSTKGMVRLLFSADSHAGAGNHELELYEVFDFKGKKLGTLKDFFNSFSPPPTLIPLFRLATSHTGYRMEDGSENNAARRRDSTIALAQARELLLRDLIANGMKQDHYLLTMGNFQVLREASQGEFAYPELVDELEFSRRGLVLKPRQPQILIPDAMSNGGGVNNASVDAFLLHHAIHLPGYWFDRKRLSDLLLAAYDNGSINENDLSPVTAALKNDDVVYSNDGREVLQLILSSARFLKYLTPLFITRRDIFAQVWQRIPFQPRLSLYSPERMGSEDAAVIKGS
jgi:hypothetical protein